MSDLKQIVLLICCFMLTGCAGLADYTIPLENGYRIDRLSAHQIGIYGDQPVKTEKENVQNYIYVPAKVTEVWQDDQYIVAKQVHLYPDERGYKEPPQKTAEDDYSYWIIEMETHEVYGPLSQQKFENESKQLFGKEITFTPIEKLTRD